MDLSQGFFCFLEEDEFIGGDGFNLYAPVRSAMWKSLALMKIFAKLAATECLFPMAIVSMDYTRMSILSLGEAEYGSAGQPAHAGGDYSPVPLLCLGLRLLCERC